jgi:phosphatidylinositol glycan class B
MFPLAILATAFPVLGFSPRLPLWPHTFAHLWQWRTSWVAKIITAISLAAMVYFAIYPFGVRPHMPMAEYLYRHDPGPIYSFAAPFGSYPMYRPAGFRAQQLKDRSQLNSLLGQGPIFLMSQTPEPPALPAGLHATLIYSEFPLARFGYGQLGQDYIQGYSSFAARHPFLKLLPLYWYTLYRVERS